MGSFNATIDNYRALLATLDSGNLKITNENFDTGIPTVAGEYAGADLAYDKLLDKLAGHKFANVSADLRNNILVYYKDRKPPTSPPAKKSGDAWAKVLEGRAQLEQMEPETAATR
jgi:hypothetical protein